jgi:hypothetical protein
VHFEAGATDDSALVSRIRRSAIALAYDPSSLGRPAALDAFPLSRVCCRRLSRHNVMVISLALCGALDGMSPASGAPSLARSPSPFPRARGARGPSGAVPARRAVLTLDVPVVLGFSTAFAASMPARSAA